MLGGSSRPRVYLNYGEASRSGDHGPLLPLPGAQGALGPSFLARLPAVYTSI